VFKVGYGVRPFEKKYETKKDVEKILTNLKEGQMVRVQKLPPERTCMVPLWGQPCGKKYIPDRMNQKHCSPWCQNRAATQTLRAARAKVKRRAFTQAHPHAQGPDEDGWHDGYT
jgi:hypothetical protein